MSLKNMPIRKKILLSMLAFTLIPIILVSTVALSITYKTMRDQLIYDRRMSSNWLQDRLTIESRGSTSSFYEFEINKEVKEDILIWCVPGGTLDYSARWRLISVMNSIISMDSAINSIELFNLSGGTVLIAERSGAKLEETASRLDFWRERDPSSQTNLVYFREGNEILAAHRIVRFEDNRELALAVIHYRPYQLQHLLNEIETENDETILLFNDENMWIESDLGGDWEISNERVLEIKEDLISKNRTEAYANGRFWFYRPINGGKMFLILTVSNQTLVEALRPTLLVCVLVAIIGIFASLICSIIYSKTISNPIRKLSGDMKTLTINEFSGSFAEDREDEIGILQESFDQMISRNKELITQQYQGKIEKRNAQIRALQAQINPHFMYNTLQVIGGMALESQAPSIYNMTVALSDLLRYSLNFSKEMVPLSEELGHLESYIMIQNERFGGRIQFSQIIAEDTKNCLIPKLILQPLVENSFEHGLLDKPGSWEIQISSRRENGDLFIEVHDNGLGFSPARLQEIRSALEEDSEKALQTGSHIGLGNIQARIRLRYPGEKCGLIINSTENLGTTVTVHTKATDA